jgi:phage terminase small subunit
MPRRSASSLSVMPAFTLTPPVLKPPPRLSPEAQAVFSLIVASCDVDHFQPADAYLLAQYTEAIVMAEEAATELHKDVDGKWLLLWEKATRTMVALSMRLRLSPQARREKAQTPRKLTWSERAGLERQALAERLR